MRMAKSMKESDQENNKRRFYPYFIAIFVLSFVFYGNSLKNGYSLDDNLVTSTYDNKHPTIEGGIAALPKVFTSHFVVNSKQSYAYRPVTTTSFAIEFQFFGQNPAASHFFNILLYAIAIVVLFKLLNQIWGEEKYILTILTCLIFLIHPIHTEVVNNIKSRDELLCFLFGILAIKQTLNYFDRQKVLSLVLAIFFILLSLLSKKTGMIFIAITPLTLYYFRSVSLKKIGLVVGSVLIGFILFRVMTKTLIDDPVSRVKHYFENPLFYSGYAERIPMYFYSNYYYLALLLFPYPLRYYYGFDQVPIADWSNPMVYVMLLLMTASVGLVLWRIKKKEIWGYGLLFYLLAIGGACNLLFPAVGIIAERFAFVASLGFSILIGFTVYHFFFKESSKLIKQKAIAKYAIGGLGFICLVYVFNRNTDWKSDVSLYKNDIVHLDRSYKAHNLLGQTYYKEGLNLLQNNQPPATYTAKIDSAEIEFKKCLSLYQGYAVTYNNLGALFFTFRRQEDSAYLYFEKAIQLDSTYTEALYNMGNIEIGKYNAYSNIHHFSSKISDTLQPLSNEDQISAASDQLLAIGKLLQDIKTNLPSTIVAAGNKSNSQQEFLSNLQNNVITYLTSISAIDWFDQNEFGQILITNSQAIIESYESGHLNQHLYNFVGLNIASSIFQAGDLEAINLKSIEDWSAKNMEEMEILFIKHFNKCLDYTPTYYPSFKSLNGHYKETQDYLNLINLNRKIVSSKGYPYNHEFYNNIATAHYMQNNMDSCKVYLELAIKEIDLAMQENQDTPNASGNLLQYREGMVTQLEQINQQQNILSPE